MQEQSHSTCHVSDLFRNVRFRLVFLSCLLTASFSMSVAHRALYLRPAALVCCAVSCKTCTKIRARHREDGVAFTDTENYAESWG